MFVPRLCIIPQPLKGGKANVLVKLVNIMKTQITIQIHSTRKVQACGTNYENLLRSIKLAH